MHATQVSLLRFVIVCSIFLLAASPAWTQLPTDFQEETLVSNLNQPVAMAFLPDGRLMIGQRNETILITTNPRSETSPFDLQAYSSGMYTLTLRLPGPQAINVSFVLQH